MTFKFDAHRAVRRNIISIGKRTRCTNVSNLFYFGMTLYMFRTVFLSIISSSRLYIQQQAFVKQILLSASQRVGDVPSTLYMFRTVFRPSSAVQDFTYSNQTDTAVCLLAGTRPSETCTVSLQNKINLIHWCIQLVLLQKLYYDARPNVRQISI